MLRFEERNEGGGPERVGKGDALALPVPDDGLMRGGDWWSTEGFSGIVN